MDVIWQPQVWHGLPRPASPRLFLDPRLIALLSHDMIRVIFIPEEVRRVLSVNVVPIDADVFVSVRPVVFVGKAEDAEDGAFKEIRTGTVLKI